MTNELIKTMPHSLSAEMALIGSILFNNAELERCDAVEPGHFYAKGHGELWAAIRGLTSKGMAATEESVRDWFSGGVFPVASDYFDSLVDAAAFGSEINDFSRMIVDLHQRRLLISAGDALKAAAYGTGEGYTDPAKVLNDFEAEIEGTRKSIAGSSERHWKRAPDTVVTMLADIRESLQSGAERGITTGITKLDTATGGFKAGDLVIVAGASSMGKTCVASNIAFGAANKGRKVAFFSQEMSEAQLAMRLASREARRRGVSVPYYDLDNATLTMAQLERLEALTTQIPDNIVVNQQSSQTAQEIRTKSRAAQKMMGGLDMIVVDYLQIMNVEQKPGSNRAAAVGDATAALKALAKEMACPVVVLSQLARLKGREDKRPQLDDLRDSGSIEQDADKVLFVYRENYYIGRQEPEMRSPDWHEWAAENARTKHLLEINIAKNRMGRIGLVELWIDMGCDLILSDAAELDGAEVHSMRGQAS
jgi:replicative DNA helicase